MVEQPIRKSPPENGRAVGHKNFLGQHMPPWDELPESIPPGLGRRRAFLVLKETI